MTKLAEKAIKTLNSLSENEQDAYAQILLDEMESEIKWDKLLASKKSQDFLKELSEEALEEFKQGKTIPWEDLDK